MKGKRITVESKCGTSCNDGVDRISALPDDIILHILSYLLLDCAGRTSALSTRWRDLWKYIPNLHLFKLSIFCDMTSETGTSVDFEKNAKFVTWVNSIVENHKALPLKKFLLYSFLDKSSHSTIAKWLEFAFSKRVEDLILTFGDERGLIYGAEPEAEDKLVVFDELLRMSSTNLLKSSNLKILYLENLKMSGEAIKVVLHDCLFLEILTIRRAVFTSDIEVCGGALKHLEISAYKSGKSIKVSAPNLIYLDIHDDDDERGVLLIENVPKLVVADFGSCIASNMKDFCFVSHLQILTIFFVPLDFLAKEIPTMPKLIKLNVSYYGLSKYLIPTLAPLVKASPLLQTFNLNKHMDRGFDYEHDMEVGNVEAFKHQHLRVFKFSKFDVEAVEHMEFVSFILHNCVALGKITIEVGKSYDNLSPDIERAEREADAKKVKQLLQPRLPLVRIYQNKHVTSVVGQCLER